MHRTHRTLLGLTRAISRRPELLRSPEPEGGGGGGEAKLSLTQAELDALIQKRVGPLTEKLRAAETQAAEIATIKAKLAEADSERQAQVEAKALEGKTELEKLQHQLTKADKIRKEGEDAWKVKESQYTAALEAGKKELNDFVVRSHVSGALASGVADGALKAAEMLFLTEAQIELTEDRQIKSLAVGGKTFEKPSDAATHFLSQNKYLAKAPEGGSGTPRNGGAGGGAAGLPGTVGGLLSSGLAQAKAS